LGIGPRGQYLSQSSEMPGSLSGSACFPHVTYSHVTGFLRLDNESKRLLVPWNHTASALSGDEQVYKLRQVTKRDVRDPTPVHMDSLWSALTSSMVQGALGNFQYPSIWIALVCINQFHGAGCSTKLPISVHMDSLWSALTSSTVQGVIRKVHCYSADQEISHSHGTRGFITMSAKAHHWTLPWATCIQFTPSYSASLTFISYHHPIYALAFWMYRFLNFSAKLWTHLSSPPRVLHDLPISHSLV
jgi:hypothetical protein